MKKGAFSGAELIKGILTGFVAGSVNGLFGSGGGTIVVPAMAAFLGIEDHKSHATAIFVILPLTVISSFFYLSNNYVDWSIVIKVVAGGLAGGYIGARLLNICPSGLLRKVFAVFLIITGLRMLGIGQLW